MKKSVFLFVAGMAVLTGCRNEVMAPRQYTPVDGNGPVNQIEPMDQNIPAVQETPAVKAAPAQYAPMVYTGPTEKGLSNYSGSTSAAAGTYVVKPGDTIGKIAYAHKIKPSALLKANNMDEKSARRMRVGQKLILPGGKAATAVSGAKSPAKAAVKVSADGTYTVKAGDSIDRIARRLGVKSSELKKVNNLSDADTRRLQIGQKLIVPGAKSVPAEKPAAPEAVKPVSEAAPQAPAPVAPAETGTAAAPAPAPTALDTDMVDITEDIAIADFAKKYNVSVEELRRANSDIKGDTLKSGDLVFIPKK